jgi:hypothetical protein
VKIKNWVFILFTLCIIGCDGDSSPVSEPPVFQKDTGLLGVWCWDDSNLNWNTYFDFIVKNGVTEIYYSSTDFSERTEIFIEKASHNNIKVFFLTGKYEYINDRSGIIGLMDNFILYQNGTTNTKKFSGVHLDVEPQQHPEFSRRYGELLQDYIDFVVWFCSEYKTQTSIDFDIPFWFDDEIIYKSQNIKLYEAVITEASRVFIMSYRDKSDEIYDISKDEINFAKLKNKQIVLGVETDTSAEGGNITFFEEGKSYMYNEIHKLHPFCKTADYGISIHHLRSWYDLRN